MKKEPSPSSKEKNLPIADILAQTAGLGVLLQTNPGLLHTFHALYDSVDSSL